MKWALFTAAILAIAGSAQAQTGCDVSDWAGRVIDRHPGATVQRGNQSLNALYPLRLCAGDHVRLPAGSALQVTLQSGFHPLQADAEPLDFIVPTPDAPSPAGRAILNGLSEALDAGFASVAKGPRVRDPNLPIAALKLIPAGKQMFPKGYNRLALLWQGAATTLAFSRDDKTSILAMDGGEDHIDISIKWSQPYTITLPNKAARWDIDFADAPPSVPGLPDQPLGSRDRLARAAWLLQHGAPEWHAFAYTEISSLMDEDFLAQELYLAAKSGALSAKEN